MSLSLLTGMPVSLTHMGHWAILSLYMSSQSLSLPAWPLHVACPFGLSNQVAGFLTHGTSGIPKCKSRCHRGLQRLRLISCTVSQLPHSAGDSGLPSGQCEESAYSAGDTVDAGSIIVLGRYLGGEHGNPAQYICREKSHRQRNQVGYGPWGYKESGTAEATEYAHTYW